MVFYKHQIEEALKLSKAVKEAGYQLFVQPMVTVDYTLDEYVEVEQILLAEQFYYKLAKDFCRGRQDK